MKLRPTPALVVAVLALVVAMAGTSYAAAKITSAQIKNNTIKSKDIKDNEVAGKDVKDASLTGADIADGSLTAADLPPASAPKCAADQFRLATGCLIKAVRPGGATTQWWPRWVAKPSSKSTLPLKSVATTLRPALSTNSLVNS